MFVCFVCICYVYICIVFLHIFVVRTQAGDQIVRVNGLVLSETTHEEFLNLMKLRKTYTLTLKGTPILPLGTLHLILFLCVHFSYNASRNLTTCLFYGTTISQLAFSHDERNALECTTRSMLLIHLSTSTGIYSHVEQVSAKHSYRSSVLPVIYSNIPMNSTTCYDIAKRTCANQISPFAEHV